MTLYVGDGETVSVFLNDVRKLWNDSSSVAQQSASGAEATQLGQDVLRPAVLDAIHVRERLKPSANAAQTYPVNIIYVKHARPGRILLAEPTSFTQ